MIVKSSRRAAERAGALGKEVVSVDPFSCRMWQHHDRLEDHLSEDACRAEIGSYSQHGQLIPVLGRRLRNDHRHKIELIYGARRLFVAKHLRLPLLVELRELTDQEAVIAMEIENHQRAATSPYERGLCFSRWLRNGVFESQDEIARALGISKSQVSRYLKLTTLPSVVVQAFASPSDICEWWGLELIEAWENPQRREALARAVEEISKNPNRPSAREVHRQLMDGSPHPRRRASTSYDDEVIRDHSGDPLFRIRRQRDSITVLLPMASTSKDLLQETRNFLAEMLQYATEQLPRN